MLQVNHDKIESGLPLRLHPLHGRNHHDDPEGGSVLLPKVSQPIPSDHPGSPVPLGIAAKGAREHLDCFLGAKRDLREPDCAWQSPKFSTEPLLGPCQAPDQIHFGLPVRLPILVQHFMKPDRRFARHVGIPPGIPGQICLGLTNYQSPIDCSHFLFFSDWQDRIKRTPRLNLRNQAIWALKYSGQL
jgi:hypothetical protein